MDFSILIPVFNAENTLRATLESILTQTTKGFSWEVVAVNDGSKDQSLSLLEEIQKEADEKNVPLRFFHQENRGVAETRNRLVREARGEFLLFVDADDLLEPDALQTLYETQRETNASLLVFDAQFLDRDGNRRPFPVSELPGGPMSARDYMLVEPAPWNKLIRASLFTDAGLTFPPNIWYEDLATIPALADALPQGTIHYLKRPLYLYYLSPDSITRSAYSEKRMNILPALETLKGYAPNHPEEVEYLAWFHLYRTFVWIWWNAGKTDAIRKANAFMKEQFPHWQKNPLIPRRHGWTERLCAKLFYREWFWLIRLWKGTNK